MKKILLLIIILLLLLLLLLSSLLYGNGRNGCRILVSDDGEEPIAYSREGDTVNRMMSTSNKCKDSRIIEFITFVCTFLLMWQTIFIADVAVQALFKFFGLVLRLINLMVF